MSKSSFLSVIFVSLLSLQTCLSYASSFIKDEIVSGDKIKDNISFRGRNQRASTLIMELQRYKGHHSFSNTKIFKYNSKTKKIKKQHHVKQISLRSTMEIRDGNFVYSECYDLKKACANFNPDNQIAAIIVGTKDQKFMHNLARKNLMKIIEKLSL